MKKDKEQQILIRFLKDYIIEEDKKLTSKEICSKYRVEINELCKYDKDTTDVFGFYNTWWVFGEVAKEFDYNIFMAEAENVGYKRTKRGEKPMPNDLFDLEYAPNSLKLTDVTNYYDNKIASLTNELNFLKVEKKNIDKAQKEKETATLLRKSNLLKEQIEDIEKNLKACRVEKNNALHIYNTYYEKDKIKLEYFDRTDKELIAFFDKGIMKRWVSTDILLREKEEKTILDSIRKSVKWD
jgi:type I restriction enzyme M protein